MARTINLPKPEYFWNRWKTATNPDKRAYFASRLSSMGIDVATDTVLSADNRWVVIGRSNRVYARIIKMNWHTGQQVGFTDSGFGTRTEPH